jgi:hypothetical protein
MFQLNSLAFAYHIRETIIGSFRVFGASSPMIQPSRADSPACLVNPTGPWAGRGYSSGPLSRSRCIRHVRQCECLDDTSEVWADDACRHKESLRDHSGSLRLRGHESNIQQLKALPICVYLFKHQLHLLFARTCESSVADVVSNDFG